MRNTNKNSVDDYISNFPPSVQTILTNIRKEIITTAPDATEGISYGIPTYKINGTNLVHFAAFKNHIGFYPTPSGVEFVKDKFGKYKVSKGAIQFPLKEDIPYALIKLIVKFRIKEISLRNQQ